MGWFLRLLALSFFFGPPVAMLSEPFFEALFDILGWDTEDLAIPIAKWVVGMTTIPAFWSVSLGLMGLGAGVWLHYLATAFDRKYAPTNLISSLSIDVYRVRENLDDFIQNPQRNPKITVDDPTAPTGETAKARSLIAALKKYGVPTPKIGPKIDEPKAVEVSEYLATISSFVSNDQKKECRKIAKEFLASKRDERPRLLSRLGILKETPPKTPRD